MHLFDHSGMKLEINYKEKKKKNWEKHKHIGDEYVVEYVVS